jgi:hypothetical protein
MLWKEDPSSPHNHSIIKKPLVWRAGWCISDGCKVGNGGHGTRILIKDVWIGNHLVTAVLARAVFSDNAIPTFFTNKERIRIATTAIHVTQYTVPPTKLRMIRMNMANVGRDLSPRHL